jgi:hypothetical protein
VEIMLAMCNSAAKTAITQVAKGDMLKGWVKKKIRLGASPPPRGEP